MSASAAPPPAVVFLHGIGGAARIWKRQLETFAAAGLAPVALDLPGYGGREAVQTMDFDGLAADVEATIDARRLERPVLVGHSMGGMVVQTMLRRRPGGYVAVALACTSPAFGGSDGDFQRKFVSDRLGPLDAGKTMADLAPRIVDGMVGSGAVPEARAQAIEIMSAVPADTYRAAVRCLVTFDERANLSKITVPVICLGCEKDPNAPPAMVERTAGKILGAKYTCLPGIGHLPNLEAPAAFDAAILGFLRDRGLAPPLPRVLPAQ